MLNNLKVVLLEHRRFLLIFFLIVFVPSIILAFFGILAIQNESYKLQQISLEQQRIFVRGLRADVNSFIEKESSRLRDLSTGQWQIEKDFQSLNDTISESLEKGDFIGQVVVWNDEIPLLQGPPPSSFAEWGGFKTDVGRAERYEFQLKNFAAATSLYQLILKRAQEDQVKAWILSRMARCEIKSNDNKQALIILREVIEDYQNHYTESGRPLGIVARMEMLDVLLAEKYFSEFFQESLHTLDSLERNFWSIESSLVQMYANEIYSKIEITLKDTSLDQLPEDFESSLQDVKNSIALHMEAWRLAETVRNNLLPSFRQRISASSINSPDLFKDILEFEDREILAIVVPLNGGETKSEVSFLGSMLEFSDLSGHVSSFIQANGSEDFTLVLRSTLSDKVLYGAIPENRIPVLTDYFSENFSSWRVDVYQSSGAGLGFPLYKNIFFWIILALLIIVFFGSALIIRTLVREVSLVNLKSEFIASVSHEFKTPLTAMGAILERLINEEVKDPEKIQEYYLLLSHDSERLKRLVKNVLDFSKIEDGKREYKFVQTDIDGLVRKEVNNFLNENKIAEFEVETTIEEGIPRVLVDEEALSQALHNILDNAAKFSGNEKKIDVEVAQKEDWIEIGVQDRGVGIPDSERKRVFEKFYRGKQASSISPTGTGLGLTLVKHIMAGHGGSVVIESQPGKGSRVMLNLPLAKGG